MFIGIISELIPLVVITYSYIDGNFCLVSVKLSWPNIQGHDGTYPNPR